MPEVKVCPGCGSRLALADGRCAYCGHQVVLPDAPPKAAAPAPVKYAVIHRDVPPHVRAAAIEGAKVFGWEHVGTDELPVGRVRVHLRRRADRPGVERLDALEAEMLSLKEPTKKVDHAMLGPGLFLVGLALIGWGVWHKQATGSPLPGVDVLFVASAAALLGGPIVGVVQHSRASSRFFAVQAQVKQRRVDLLTEARHIVGGWR